MLAMLRTNKECFPSLTKALCHIKENLTNGVLVNHSKQSLVLELMDIHILFYNLYNHFVNMLNISIMHVSDKWTE